MRDNLSALTPHYYETGVINLDNQQGDGTHWCAYAKKGNLCLYFDSFGDLRPPSEFLKYMHGVCIEYNYDRLQKFDSVNCGHLCMDFLCNIAKHMF